MDAGRRLARRKFALPPAQVLSGKSSFTLEAATLIFGAGDFPCFLQSRS
jgi:hypothetical protein